MAVAPGLYALITALDKQPKHFGDFRLSKAQAIGDLVVGNFPSVSELIN